MLLKDKVAVIYGAGGAIGGAVARAFASEGARLFLTGRNLAPVEVVAKEIVAAGGSAEAAEVDAVDEQAIDEHLQSVIDAAGRVHISFNAVGIPDTNIVGVPLVELDVEQFSLPIKAYATAYFLTARLAARRMVANKSGAIMTVTALPSRTGTPVERRLRSGTGRQGGTHPGALRRARASRDSRGRSATDRHSGGRLAQGGLRREGTGRDVGTVARVGREQDPRAASHDARGGRKHGGLHGVRQGKRDDRNERQPQHGNPGRLSAHRGTSCTVRPIVTRANVRKTARSIRTRTLSEA
jgi:NAD(P)-dependent dehydrogenase (short-subunit alcohol dehydrogenase family)